MIQSIMSQSSLMLVLHREVDEEEVEVMVALVEGLAKLMLHQELQLQMTIRLGSTMHIEVCVHSCACNTHPPPPI